MEDRSPKSTDPRPRLWNPYTAILWSLLFSPVLGTYLHAANWRALGKPERAKANLIWLGVFVLFLVIPFVWLPLIDSEPDVLEELTAVDLLDKVWRIVAICAFYGWYARLAKAQVNYVEDSEPNGYIKKSWIAPLMTGMAGMAVYLVIIFVFLVAATATVMPEANDVAAEIKPLILRKWEESPELLDATIQNVSLVHQGDGQYVGFINATIQRESIKLNLEVNIDQGMIQWSITP